LTGKEFLIAVSNGSVDLFGELLSLLRGAEADYAGRTGGQLTPQVDVSRGGGV